MAQSVVLTGAQVKVYFGGTLLNDLQNIAYTVNYGENEIYGIDSAFPQEIAQDKITVKGSGTIVYVQANGGLQGKGMRSLVHEMAYSPYISLRIKDRKNNSDIFFCPQVKITQENTTINSKGVVRISFNFSGIVPYGSEDLA